MIYPSKICSLQLVSKKDQCIIIPIISLLFITKIQSLPDSEMIENTYLIVSI